MRGLLLLSLGAYQALRGLLFSAMSLLGAPNLQCKFVMSCSEFAKAEIQTNPRLSSAIFRIGRRLLFCSPLKNKWTESLTQCVELPQNAVPDLRKV